MNISDPRQSDDLILRAMLIDKAKEHGRHVDDDWTHACYIQDDNPDALTDAWLGNRTSYIHRVGVLVIWDANKCDWCELAIGHRKQPDHRAEFVGILYWSDGESDDPARMMKRALKAASRVHPVFNADES